MDVYVLFCGGTRSVASAVSASIAAMTENLPNFDVRSFYARVASKDKLLNVLQIPRTRRSASLLRMPVRSPGSAVDIRLIVVKSLFALRVPFDQAPFDLAQDKQAHDWKPFDFAQDRQDRRVRLSLGQDVMVGRPPFSLYSYSDFSRPSPNFSPAYGCNGRYGTPCFVTLHQPPRRIAEDTSAGSSVASLAVRTISAVSLRKPVRSPG